MFRLPVTIGGRVIALLLLLATVAMAGAGVTFAYAKRQEAAQAALDRADESRPLIERLRAGIYQVVMESRGLYLAADRKQAEGFARNLLRGLEDIRTSFAQLREAVPEAHRPAVQRAEAPLQAFLTLRTELARVHHAAGAQRAAEHVEQDLQGRDGGCRGRVRVRAGQGVESGSFNGRRGCRAVRPSELRAVTPSELAQPN